jgi:hypothetical protein
LDRASGAAPPLGPAMPPATLLTLSHKVNNQNVLLT